MESGGRSPPDLPTLVVLLREPDLLCDLGGRLLVLYIGTWAANLAGASTAALWKTIHNQIETIVENIRSKAFSSGTVVWISGENVEDIVEKGVDFNQLIML